MTVGELRRKLTELPENLNRIAVPDIMNVVDVMRDGDFLFERIANDNSRR